MGINGFFNYFTEEGNVITVDSATDGNIHYQCIDFSASDHVEKLIPKFNLNCYIAQFIISSLKFATKGKFSYGYKFNQNRIRKQTFKLPVNDKNELDYDFIEQYMINLESKLLNKYLQLII